MSNAKYKYSIKAPSGYSSSAQGEVTPAQHQAICNILDGMIGADAAVHADTLLEALVDAEEIMRGLGAKSPTALAAADRYKTIIAAARGEK